MNLESGRRLGPYEIVTLLGVGGMGEVYRARDTRLDRIVAIKVLPAHLTSNDASRARFEREARAISALSHPNICALYDVGREGETEYLVMEYWKGRRSPTASLEVRCRGVSCSSWERRSPRLCSMPIVQASRIAI